MFLGKLLIYNYQKPSDHLYLELSTTISHLNDFMCGPLNRKGLLCSDCLDGFGHAVFTTGSACENCTGQSYFRIALHLLLELVPITAFYLLILVFQIRVTSAPLNGFILYSQAVVIAYNYLVALHGMFVYTGTSFNILAKIIFTGYGIWNLELPLCCSTILSELKH